MTSEHRHIVTISKADLALLTAETYQGSIEVIDTFEMVDHAVATLRDAEIIGFDTETRPSFKKGQSFHVALLQLSTHECCYLFRLNVIGMPDSLKALLEDDDKLKIGLSLHDDFHNLAKICQLKPAGFIDLQTYVKDFMIADNSLARIYAILFGKRISKGQRLTNWEAKHLTDAQQSYASLDALACIHIYEHLKGGNFDPWKSEYLQEVIPEEEAADTQADAGQERVP